MASRLTSRETSLRAEPRGALVAVEGIDNVGKSTAVEGLARRLSESGRLVTVLNEFGPDAVGRAVRSLVRERWSEVPAEAQPLLIAADRYPRYLRAFNTLDDPRSVVLCDRYLHSAVVYQAVSAGVPPAEMADTVRALYGDCFRAPDLTLFLNASVETSARRGGTNIHSTEYLDTCSARLREFSFGEKRVVVDAEADEASVLRACEAAVLREVPPVTRAAVPLSAYDYCRSRHGGEVLFALRRGAEVFLQRKRWYPPGVHRVAGGGVEEGEGPLDALRRELYEEAGLALEELDYKLVTTLVYNEEVGEDSFASYLFEIEVAGAQSVGPGPAPDEGFEVWEAFDEARLRRMAALLRSCPARQADWGAFRAAALDAYLGARARGA